VFIVPVNATRVTVTDDEFDVICVAKDVERGAIDALKEIRLELTGINEELFVPTTELSATIVVVNEELFEVIAADIEELSGAIDADSN
jgi:hypothetical protein